MFPLGSHEGNNILDVVVEELYLSGVCALFRYDSPETRGDRFVTRCLGYF